MRVILTQNVVKLGEVGDVCNVAPGYGRNYLIPQGMAIVATPGALKQIDDLKRTERRRQDRMRAEMEDLARDISRLRLEFPARVGETGRLYGSITAANIAEAIEADLGREFDRRKIILDESIRTLGDHDVSIHLMPGVDAHVHVIVVPDGELVPDALADDLRDAEGDIPQVPGETEADVDASDATELDGAPEEPDEASDGHGADEDVSPA